MKHTAEGKRLMLGLQYYKISKNETETMALRIHREGDSRVSEGARKGDGIVTELR